MKVIKRDGKIVDYDREEKEEFLTEEEIEYGYHGNKPTR